MLVHKIYKEPLATIRNMVRDCKVDSEQMPNGQHKISLKKQTDYENFDWKNNIKT